MSDDTSDRELLYELYLRPLAIDAVRRFHEPYHFSTNDVMDLMNLPHGMAGDHARHFIVGVLRIIVHDTVPDAVEQLDLNHNTITFYSPELGPSGNVTQIEGKNLADTSNWKPPAAMVRCQKETQ